MGLAGIVFFITLALTFGASIYARLRTRRGPDADLAGRGLNRWLVGLSAGTTGNSGFIVTAAVGMGYVGGLRWMPMAFGWMLGDLLFWALFPARLNRYAREMHATTLSELLIAGLSSRAARAVSLLAAVLLLTFLGFYTSAQWMAGKKFLSSIFALSGVSAVAFFAFVIILYSSLGGFLGSVYTDVIQAVVRIVGTGVALGAVCWQASLHRSRFWHHLSEAGPGFLHFFPDGWGVGLAFLFGWVGAALGFGLGQPQIVSRYLAGKSPEETRAAWWICIGFVQLTWVSMMLFGLILRGVMPGIADPETGMSLFFRDHVHAVLTGIIFADIFATIASTSNGVLVAMSQIVRHDLLGRGAGWRVAWLNDALLTFAIGLVTVLLSLTLSGNVFSSVIASFSKVGAAIAAPVIVKVLRWRHNGLSLLASMAAGWAAAMLWSYGPGGAYFNEAGIGIAAGLLVNFAFAPKLKS